VDLAAGHGLTAWMLLVMEPACRSALCVDITRPDSSRSLEVAMTKAWPRLAGRVRYVTGRLEDVRPHPDCLLIAIHACGPLTDFVIRLAETSGATLAVMPCCHSARTCDTGGLEKWLPLGAAVDATRATHLGACGYAVTCETIPLDITPENRVIMASPGTRALSSKSRQGANAVKVTNADRSQPGSIPIRVSPTAGVQDKAGVFKSSTNSHVRSSKQISVCDARGGRSPIWPFPLLLPDSPWKRYSLIDEHISGR